MHIWGFTCAQVQQLGKIALDTVTPVADQMRQLATTLDQVVAPLKEQQQVLQTGLLAVARPSVPKSLRMK